MVRPWSGGNPSVSMWALAYVRDVLTGQEVKELPSPCRHRGTCKFCDSQHPPEKVPPFPFYCLKEHDYYFLLWKECSCYRKQKTSETIMLLKSY